MVMLGNALIALSCSNCGHEEAIFGVGGGEAMA